MDNSSQEVAVRVIDVPDLVNLIADFCDDESLSKVSRVIFVVMTLKTSKGVRKMIIEESKDRYIRVLEYKYMRVCLLMDVMAITMIE